MHEDIEGATETAEQSDESEDEQLLRVEGKVHGEVGRKHGGDCVRFLEPNGQQPEDRGPADGSEEAPPVIAHRKVRRRYFDAEQDSW